MKKIISALILGVVLSVYLFSSASAQQTLPSCLTGAVKNENDPTAYVLTVGNNKKITVWLNNRYADKELGTMGTWQCSTTNPKNIVLTPDKKEPTGGVSGVRPDSATGTTTTSTTACTGANCTSSGKPTNFDLLVKLNNPLKVGTIQGAIQLFMNTVVKIAIPFIVVFFVYAGFRFILARGNPKELETAKRMFWYTILGSLLIFGAWAITNAIVGTINSISS